MTDSLRSFSFDPPAKGKLVDREGDITAAWLIWCNNIATRVSRVTVATADVDPPSIASGDTHQATVTVPGVRAGQFVQASFVPGDTGVGVSAQCVTDGQVVVTFRNFTGGAIDLPAGTIRLRIDGD